MLFLLYKAPGQNTGQYYQPPAQVPGQIPYQANVPAPGQVPYQANVPAPGQYYQPQAPGQYYQPLGPVPGQYYQPLPDTQNTLCAMLQWH